MIKLYDGSFERENCGVGLIANIDGVQSHKVVCNGILGLSRMQHRGAILADSNLFVSSMFFNQYATCGNWNRTISR